MKTILTFLILGCALALDAATVYPCLVGPGVNVPYKTRFYPDNITNGILAHWKIDETGSGQRFDSTANAIHLVASTSISSIAGKINNANDLPNSSGFYLSSANNQFQFGDTSFTVTGWVWLDVLTANKVVFSGSTVSTYGYVMDFNGTFFKFHVSANGSSDAATVTSAVSVSTGTWYFFRCWHDAETDQIGIQVNTESEVTASHSTGTFATSLSFFVGRRADSAADLDGRVDSFSVWKRHLPSNYHTQLYNNGFGLDWPF